MTEPKQQPKTHNAHLGYTAPYPGGGATYIVPRDWQGDPRDVDEMIAQEADDHYHALKDDGRLDR